MSASEPSTPSTANIERLYQQAQEEYQQWGVDTDAALRILNSISISMHCWQGDDVGGFENSSQEIGGGLAVTGNYPGRARTASELRQDLELAKSLIPGPLRLNLHASYAETEGRQVDRDALTPIHFQHWLDWAKQQQLGLDFNSTFFAHPLAESGLTLSHPDRAIRQFWVAHGQACRKIAANFGQHLGSPCIHNVWIPDGSKDQPVDRLSPRERLVESLDEVFRETFHASHVRDSVESKLFGLGSESYVVGSHEFYLGYAIRRGKLLCLDAGHFHPTETISDKISAVLTWVDEILLHVSRGIRWDSDHVVTLSEDLLGITQEVVRGGFLGRVHIGLDYFDATINRIAAWVIGTRALRRGLLIALLEPLPWLRKLEAAGDFTSRLALLEEFRSLPWGVVWDYYCMTQNIPVRQGWLPVVREYEHRVLSQRS